MRFGLVLLLLLLPASALAGHIIYVDVDADGHNDGSSWENAYRFLQDALADANNSAKPVEVRVAQGTYKPDRGTNVRAGDSRATFQLINGVALRGGYVGLGGLDPNARDIGRYKSILSGDLGGDDRDVNDPRDLLLSMVGANSAKIVTGSSTDSTAVLEGFVITRGRHYVPVVKPIAGHPPGFMGSGAGMNNLVGSPTVVACTFTQNVSEGTGAGMCNVEGSHPTITDCAFIGNYARGEGALANWSDCRPTIVRCTFAGNVADGGGAGAYNYRSAPAFDGCTFSDNSASSYNQTAGGGAITADQSICMLADCVFERNYSRFRGGALYILNDSNLTLDHCVFGDNRCDGSGGAMYERGEDSNFTLSHCTFTRNSSLGSSGGAMELNSPARISDCIFSGNCARTSGGAAVVRTATFTDCLFTGNRAFEHRRMEQGVIVRGEGGSGGAVYTGGSIEPLFFLNCTFAENYARYGSAVITDKFTEFRNCILRGPKPLIWPDPYEPQPQVVYCDIEHTWPGEGNIDVDPLFAKPGVWADGDDPNDPNTVWVDGDYHLKSQAERWDPVSKSWVKDEVTSPCIDAGDPNSPVGDEPQPNGGRINMGTYGGTTAASKSVVPETAQ